MPTHLRSTISTEPFSVYYSRGTLIIGLNDLGEIRRKVQYISGDPDFKIDPPLITCQSLGDTNMCLEYLLTIEN